MRTTIGVFLNLVLLPFGYYYLKQPRRFVLFLGAAFVLSPLTAALHLFVFRAGGAEAALGFLILFSLAWQLFLVLDGIRAARRPPADSVWFARPKAYLVVPGVLLVLFLGQFPASHVKRKFGNAHSIDGISSMRPALLAGDFFYATGLFAPEDIRRGDIVVFSHESSRGDVKRVIGLPGERITYQETAEMEDGLPFFRARIFINGRALEQDCPSPAAGAPPASKKRRTPPARLCAEVLNEGLEIRIRETLVPASGQGEFAEVSLGPDEYFVLADNRDYGRDSRTFGPVPAERIKEKYMYTALALVYLPGDDRPGDEPPDECAARPFRASCFLLNPGDFRIRFERVATVAD